MKWIRLAVALGSYESNKAALMHLSTRCCVNVYLSFLGIYNNISIFIYIVMLR